MTAYADHLLPPNATRFEQALSASLKRVSAVPAPIDTVKRPADAPPAFLPALAWELSTDVWDDGWDDLKKRDVIARSLAMHAKKGTLAGISAYVEAAGGEIVRAVMPPAKSFLSPSLTREEREAFLADLPQVRIFDRYEDAISQASHWDDFAGSFFTDVAGTPLLMTYESDLSLRAGRFAIHFDRGVVTPIERATASGISGEEQTVFLPGTAPGSIFCDEPIGATPWFGASTAAERVYSFNVRDTPASERVLHLFPIGPAGIDPINTVPDHVAEIGFAPASVFSDEPTGGYFVPSGAATRLYQVIYLNAPDRVSADRRAISFLDDDRFGIDPFTAELDLVVLGQRPPWIADDFVYGFFHDAPKDRLWASLDAITSAKSARDTVLVDTTVYRAMEIGQSLFVGAPLIVGAQTLS